MYCRNCGNQIDERARFCPICGTPVSGGAQFQENVDQAFQDAEDEFSSSVHEVMIDLGGGYQNDGSAYVIQHLRDDRGLISYILLSIITCGIYGYYFVYKLAQEMNIACEGDGENTPGLVAYILLSLVTCGLYDMYWFYKIGNRLANNAGRYGLSFQENGTSVLLWYLIGYLICGIGRWVAMHILIKNSNALFGAYNRYYGV